MSDNDSSSGKKRKTEMSEEERKAYVQARVNQVMSETKEKFENRMDVDDSPSKKNSKEIIKEAELPSPIKRVLTDWDESFYDPPSSKNGGSRRMRPLPRHLEHTKHLRLQVLSLLHSNKSRKIVKHGKRKTQHRRRLARKTRQHKKRH